MADELAGVLGKRLKQVQDKIALAARRAGRNPAEIELLAVTKQKTAPVIKDLVELGITLIGESYWKEAQFKIELLKDFPIEWHMVGHIQSGKEKQIAAHFDVIHSLDSLRLAEKLNKQALALERRIPVYLEFNVSGETTKGGWNAWNMKNWPRLLSEVEKILALSGLDVRGLMTMAPYSADPENARPCFRKLRELREFLNEKITSAGIQGLSMGMSGDFEVAIEEGATILRLGTALVGER